MDVMAEIKKRHNTARPRVKRIHAAGSEAVASLREPDGTPHITFEGYGTGAHGRWWRDYLGLAPYSETEIDRLASSTWGADTDDAYHEKHKLDDRDYRDLDGGRWWRDSAWRKKRGENG